MSILVTGACGRVGTALIDNLHDSYDFTYFDRVDHISPFVHIGDVADYAALDSVMDDVESLVHLAAASRVDSSWPAVLQSNIIGGYNALEAARRNRVEKVILASTNHVVGMYEEEHSPELYELDYDLEITKETPTRADSHYASSKLFNEAHAQYYIENYEYPKQVYILRLGSIRGSKNDHPYADAERGVEQGAWSRDSKPYQQEVKRMKATWQSRRDIAALIEACLEDNTVTYDIFFGVSDNDRRWLDIDHARSQIGYEPQDNGENWDSPPNSK